MAAVIGERLLAEVHEERLDEFLLDLRSISPTGYKGKTSKYRLGVGHLDDLLDVFIPAPAQRLLRSWSPAQDDQNLLSEDDTTAVGALPSLVRVDHVEPIVEVSSSSSAAGKSQLLYYLTALAVLPPALEGVDIGGRDSAVIFLDTDARFDVNRLGTVARRIVLRKLQGQDNPAIDVEFVISASLQHVHVFRPQSSSSFLATLKSLDTYLLDGRRHVSSERSLGAILVDSATAFFWPDKLRDEVSRIEDIGRPAAEIDREREQKQSFYLSDLYAELAKELKRLQVRFSCAVIYTTVSWSGKSVTAREAPRHASGPFDLYNPPAPSVPRAPSLRPPLPSPWSALPTLRLVVQQVAVRPFPPGMTPLAAEREAQMRQEVVMQGKLSCWVNGWGCEEWPSKITDGVERAGCMFVFYAHGHGVDIVR